MTAINFQIDQEDLQILYLHTREAYGNIVFNAWVIECEKGYKDYLIDRENPKTFSQWVNAQIIALCY